MKAICPIRNDEQGAGHFGAPRGSREHRGIDYACTPGAMICAVEEGEVTKLGYAYKDDLAWRYVEITDEDGARARYFYVEPEVSIREWVSRGQIIGRAQAISERYPDKEAPMQDHVHFELIINGEYVDPGAYAAA